MGVNGGLAKLRLESTALPHIWGIDGLWVPYNVDVHERVWGNRGFPVGQRQGMRVLWSLPDLPFLLPVDLSCSFTRLWSQLRGPGVQDRASTICASSLEFRASTPLDAVSRAQGHVGLQVPLTMLTFKSQNKKEH